MSMFDNIIFIASTIFPLIVYVAIGAVTAVKFNFTEDTVKSFNTLAFWVLMPANLFLIAYNYSIADKSFLKIALVGLLSLFFMAFLCAFIALRLCKDDRPAAAALAGISWKCNCIMLGIPVAQSFLSPEGAMKFTILAIIVDAAVSNMILIPQISFILKTGEKKSFLSQLKAVLLNPIVFSTLLGAVFNLVGIKLPQLIVTPIQAIANTNLAICMIIIGVSMGVRRHISNIRLVGIACFLKLVLCPVCGTLIAYIFGIRGSGLGAVCLFWAVPSAVNAGITIEAMGGDGSIGNSTLVLSTVLSAITLFIVGVLIRTIGWM